MPRLSLPRRIAVVVAEIVIRAEYSVTFESLQPVERSKMREVSASL
jgi:hypothetical protein